MSAYCPYRAPEYSQYGDAHVAYMPPPYEGSASLPYYPHGMPVSSISQRHRSDYHQSKQRAGEKNCSQKDNTDDDRYEVVKIKLNSQKNDQKEEF